MVSTTRSKLLLFCSVALQWLSPGDLDAQVQAGGWSGPAKFDTQCNKGTTRSDVGISGDFAVVRYDGCVGFHRRGPDGWVADGVFDISPSLQWDSGFTSTSVAIRGAVAIVGWHVDDTVLIFRRHADGWVEEARLQRAGTGFGHSVDFDGEVLVVGAPKAGQGSMFFFEYSDGTNQWLETQRFEPGYLNQFPESSSHRSTEGVGLGHSVSVQDDLAVAGSTHGGWVLFLRRSAVGVWAEEKRVQETLGTGRLPSESDDHEIHQGFGQIVAINETNNDEVLIAAPLWILGVERGRAFRYQLVQQSQRKWITTWTFNHPDPVLDADIHGDMVAITHWASGYNVANVLESELHVRDQLGFAPTPLPAQFDRVSNTVALADKQLILGGLEGADWVYTTGLLPESRRPVLTGPIEVVATVGENMIFNVRAWDPASGQYLASTHGALPPGSAFNGTQFTMTTATGGAGTYVVNFMARSPVKPYLVGYLATTVKVEGPPIVSFERTGQYGWWEPWPTPTAGVTTAVGQQLRLRVLAARASTGDPTPITLDGLPPGATFQADDPVWDHNGVMAPPTMTLEWTPVAYQGGVYTLVFSSVDAEAPELVREVSVDITVNDPTPVLEVPATTFDVLPELGLAVEMSAHEVYPPNPIPITTSQLPPGAGFDGRVLRWSPAGSQEGTYTIRFEARARQFAFPEVTGATVDEAVITVNVLAGAPQFQPLPSSLVAYPRLPVTFDVAANRRAAGAASLPVQALELPVGATFVDGRFEWTPHESDVGPHEVRFRATDPESGLTTDPVVRLSVVLALAPQRLLTGPAGTGADRFGTAVAVSGDVAVVGAVGTNKNRDGKVHIFRLAEGNWVREATLLSTDLFFEERFGAAVAVDQDVLVVGAPFNNRPGAAYIYRFDPTSGQWLQEAFVQHGGTSFDGFGSAVAVDGDVVVVGGRSPYPSSSVNNVHVYRRVNGEWLQEARLASPSPIEAADFGAAVAIDGDRLVIGAPLDGDDPANRPGSVIAYSRSAGQWLQTQRIVGTAGSAAFGSAVHLEEDELTIGAEGYFFGSGRVHTFELFGGTWEKTGILLPGDDQGQARFGNAISRHGDLMVIGAAFQSGPGSQHAGAAYLYEREPDGTWLQLSKLANSTRIMGDQFGASYFRPFAGVNEPPTMEPLSDYTVTAGTTLTFSVSATDPDPNQDVQISAGGLPPDASFDGSVFSWKPLSPQTHIVTFTPTDDGVPRSTGEPVSVTITVNSFVNVGTNVVSRPVDPQTGQNPVTVTFANVEAPGAVTLSKSTSPPAVPAKFFLGQPRVYYDISTTAEYDGFIWIEIFYGGVSFPDPTLLRLYHYENGIWWNITAHVDHSRRIITGKTKSLSPFLVAPALNGPPVAAIGELVQQECSSPEGAPVPLDGTSSQDPDLDEITFLWEAGGVAFDDPASPTPVGVFPHGDTQVTLTVTDARGASATATTTVTVVDRSTPVIELEGPAVVTVECAIGAYEEPGATASDDCDLEVPVTITGEVDVTTTGDYLITYHAVDASGNEAEAVSRMVRVVDTTAPTIELTGAPEMVVECALGTYDEPGAVAADACDADLAVEIQGAVDVDAPGDYLVTYQAVDAAGNHAEAVSRTVHVVDTTPPRIALNGPSEITLECLLEEYSEPGAVAADACDVDVTVVMVGEVTADVPGDYTLTYTAVDASGNTAEAVVRTVHVVDTTAPVVGLVGPPEITLECAVDAFDDPGATATDQCDPGVTVDVAGTVDAATPGDYVITYTAMDASDNEAEPVTRIVHVIDTLPPVITLEGSAEVVVECVLGSYDEPGALVVDLCDLQAKIVITGDVDVDTLGDYVVVYNAVDASGNEAAQITRLVRVVDTTPPTVTLAGDRQVVLECPAPYFEAGAAIADACDTSPALQIEGTVDTTLPGQYTVVYTGIDAAGNQTQVTRAVLVQDTTPPEILAELVAAGKRGRSEDVGEDDDDGDKDKGDKDKGDKDKGDKDKGDKDDGGNAFRVGLAATDTCDPEPPITAYVTQPLTTTDVVQVRYKRNRKKVEISIKQSRKQTDVRLTGPDETSMRQFWQRAVERGGFLVEDGQLVRLVALGRDHDDDDEDDEDDKDGGGVRFRFDKNLRLTEAHTRMPTLVASATDAAGNRSATVEVLPPYRWRQAAKMAAAPPAVVQSGVLAFPNPFNSSVTIAYEVEAAGDVALVIYNASGQITRQLMRESHVTGLYRVVWNGLDDRGADVASGIYLYRVITRNRTMTGRILLLR